MRIAYFDCFAGICGEMLLGALISAGLPLEALQQALLGLSLSGYSLDAQVVARRELSGTFFSMAEALSVTRENGNRAANETSRSVRGRIASLSASDTTARGAEEIIARSYLPDLVKHTSITVFRRLAEAEAEAGEHRGKRGGGQEEKPHSWGSGAIVTVVGVVSGLMLLGINRVECSPIHVGSGVTYSAEGIRPALSPVAAEVLRMASVPVYGSHVGGELATPVGAAIITTIASAFGAIPAMKITAVGYGAGRQDLPETPNLVRLFIGESASATFANGNGNGQSNGRHGPRTRVDELPHLGTVGSLLPSLSTSDANALPPSETPLARPLPPDHDEWATMTIQGHQQSGRQRLAS